MPRPTSFMRLPALFRLLPLAAVFGLLGCEVPPPDAYVSGGPRGDGVLVGRNSVGDPCFQYKQEGGADVYCGAWGQPAGRIRLSNAGGGVDQQAGRLAASLAPRITDCGAPQPIRFNGAAQPARMQT